VSRPGWRPGPAASAPPPQPRTLSGAAAQCLAPRLFRRRAPVPRAEFFAWQHWLDTIPWPPESQPRCHLVGVSFLSVPRRRVFLPVASQRPRYQTAQWGKGLPPTARGGGAKGKAAHSRRLLMGVRGAGLAEHRQISYQVGAAKGSATAADCSPRCRDPPDLGKSWPNRRCSPQSPMRGEQQPLTSCALGLTPFTRAHTANPSGVTGHTGAAAPLSPPRVPGEDHEVAFDYGRAIPCVVYPNAAHLASRQRIPPLLPRSGRTKSSSSPPTGLVSIIAAHSAALTGSGSRRSSR
jgi:hypothetical protein